MKFVASIVALSLAGVVVVANETPTTDLNTISAAILLKDSPTCLSEEDSASIEDWAAKALKVNFQDSVGDSEVIATRQRQLQACTHWYCSQFPDICYYICCPGYCRRNLSAEDEEEHRNLKELDASESVVVDSKAVANVDHSAAVETRDRQLQACTHWYCSQFPDICYYICCPGYCRRNLASDEQTELSDEKPKNLRSLAATENSAEVANIDSAESHEVVKARERQLQACTHWYCSQFPDICYYICCPGYCRRNLASDDTEDPRYLQEVAATESGVTDTEEHRNLKGVAETSNSVATTEATAVVVEQRERQLQACTHWYCSQFPDICYYICCPGYCRRNLSAEDDIEEEKEANIVVTLSEGYSANGIHIEAMGSSDTCDTSEMKLFLYTSP